MSPINQHTAGYQSTVWTFSRPHRMLNVCNTQTPIVQHLLWSSKSPYGHVLMIRKEFSHRWINTSNYCIIFNRPLVASMQMHSIQTLALDIFPIKGKFTCTSNTKKRQCSPELPWSRGFVLQPYTAVPVRWQERSSTSMTSDSETWNSTSPVGAPQGHKKGSQARSLHLALGRGAEVLLRKTRCYISVLRGSQHGAFLSTPREQRAIPRP